MKGTNPYGSSTNDGGGPGTAGPGISITGDVISQAVAPWVLQTSTPPTGTYAPNVDHGVFWPSATQIGSCFWQFWVRYTAGQYFISAGFSSQHAILAGFELNDAADGLVVSGNFYEGGVTVTPFITQQSDKVQVGEWVHVAIGVELGTYNRVFVWLNGILANAPSSIGARSSGPSDPAGTGLYIFGSNHSTMDGRIALAQGWDVNVFARGSGALSNAWDAFRPSFFGDAERSTDLAGPFAPDFWADYTKPDSWIPDLALNQSPPLTGTRFRRAPLHPGRLGILGAPWDTANQGIYGRPVFVLDPTFPGYLSGPRVTANAYVSATQAVPVDGKTYLLWSDFSAQRSTFVETQGPGSADPSMGSTRLGTLPVQAWQTITPQVTGTGDFLGWGIFAGCAVPLGISASTNDIGVLTAPAWVDPGVPIGGCQFRRADGCTAGSGPFEMGGALVYRRVDDSNCFVARVSSGDNVILDKWVAGVKTNIIAATAMGGSWDSLRVTIDGSNIHRLYSGTTLAGVTTWTLVATSGADAQFASATACGLTRKYGSQMRFANHGVFT